MERRVFGLDLLRSIAILSVLVAHGVPFLYRHWPQAGWLGHLGSSGVDLFFVLSGFLIGGILLRLGDKLRTPPGLIGFWQRRWLRTLPNYYVFLLLNIALGVWVYGCPPSYWRGVAACATFTQNLAWPPWMGFFPESWTLAIEESFYLLVPLAIFLLLRLGLRFRPAFAVVAVAIMGVPLLARVLTSPDATWAEGIRMPVLNRFDALAFGLAGAWLAFEYPAAWRRWRVPAAVAGVLLSGSAYWLLYRLDLNASLYARTLLFTQFSLGFALLLPWASGWQIESNAWPVAAVRAIARWSYSMYLCNWNFHVLGMRYFGDQADASLPVAISMTLAYSAASIGFAAFAYAAWERRLTALRERLSWARGAARAPV
jgi:peptidoglycan/LPS O-acetylase OafA/YrhL